MDTDAILVIRWQRRCRIFIPLAFVFGLFLVLIAFFWFRLRDYEIDYIASQYLSSGILNSTIPGFLSGAAIGLLVFKTASLLSVGLSDIYRDALFFRSLFGVIFGFLAGIGLVKYFGNLIY